MAGEYNAIVVPGGSLTPTGELALRNYSRLDTAIPFFLLGFAYNLIMTGGSQIGACTLVRPEALQMKDYAIGAGVPEWAIHTETTSRDTIGNAINVKTELLLPNDWNKILVITSASHVRRCKKIFQCVLGNEFMVDAVAAPEPCANFKRAQTFWGYLTMQHILGGVVPGDHDTIGQRLADEVPGYGNEAATLKQLRKKCLADVMPHVLNH
jgi:uncharacterized SAM-binding protein YcdF (DUF218 family)